MNRFQLWRQNRILNGPKRQLVCFKCGAAFARPVAQAAQSERSYCLNPCRPSPANKGGDTLSPFKRLFNTCGGKQSKNGRGSSRGLPMDIDPEYLRQLWNEQSGRCPVTGWTMILPFPNTSGGWPHGHHPRNASIDRIDQTKGYVRGNVRFVALMANYARHSWTDNDVVEFSRAVLSRLNAGVNTNGTTNSCADVVDAATRDHDMAAVNLPD